MNKLVSVIVPVYNSEKYIYKTLKSIIEQSYRNIEIIVINDGSIDNTKEIVEDISKSDSRIIFIDKENEGVSKTRNKGIDICSGEYIFFFDSDDTVEVDCVEKVMKCIDSNNYDTVLYGYASVRNDKILEHKLSYDKQEYLSNASIIQEVIPKSFGISYNELENWLNGKRSIREGKELTGPWRMCYSSQIVKKNKVRYSEHLKVGEDTIFTNEYLSFAERVGIVNECLYYLNNHEESTISKYLNDINGIIINKKGLVKEKFKLSQKIFERTNIDPNIYWGGEVILSTVEIAWMLTDKKYSIGFFKSYKKYLEFRRDKYVKACWNDLKININIGSKSIAVLLIKYKMDFFVLMIMKILRVFNFEINI